MEGNELLFFLVLIPFLGGLIGYLIGRKNKRIRDIFVCTVTVIEFATLFGMLITRQYGVDNYCTIKEVCGLGLHFQLDGFRAVYTSIAAFMWMMTSLFSPRYFSHYHNRNRYYLFTLFTLGATIGVFLSADLYTTFLFFEIMSFTSYVWVAQDEREESLKAAGTYLAVAVIGGLVMLMGIFLLYNMIGTLTITELHTAIESYCLEGSMSRIYAACGCIFFGFAAKAGAFPLHIWLPKAHPVAPAPASALLSGILTKAGVFGILIVSFQILLNDMLWGKLVLIIGLITMVLGAVLALFSIDLKRTLACSSMSQIGFILTGIGMGVLLGEDGVLAARGSLLHMVNHSLIKLVLFMVAGVVFMNTHQLDLNKIRGFGRKKLFLKVVFLAGALGISGIPLFNGYISKTLIHEAILEGSGLLRFGTLVEWIFLISGGLTLAYMAKLYIAVFVEKNEDDKVQITYDETKDYVGIAGKIALGVSALVLPVFGLFPNFVMDKIADIGSSFMGMSIPDEKLQYFSFANLKGGMISIIIGVLVYLFIVKKLLMKKPEGENTEVYLNAWPQKMDLEEQVYRPLLLSILPTIFGVICRILDGLIDGLVVILRKTVYKDKKLPHELEEGTIFTHLVGSFMDTLNLWLNKSVRKAHPKYLTQTYEHKLALRYEQKRETRFIISRSLSFGLALTCLGMLITIGYILYYILVNQ